MPDQDKFMNITKIQFQKAAKCKSANELLELAKTEGIEMTMEEAEAYLAEISSSELDADMLQKVSGGICWSDCPKEGSCGHHVCGTVGWENLKGC